MSDVSLVGKEVKISGPHADCLNIVKKHMLGNYMKDAPITYDYVKSVLTEIMREISDLK